MARRASMFCRPAHARALRHPDHAFDAAGDATDHRATYAADCGSHGPGGAIAGGGTFLSPAHHALSVHGDGRRQQGQHCGSDQHTRLHDGTPFNLKEFNRLPAWEVPLGAMERSRLTRR
jgi:hypothetical protein